MADIEVDVSGLVSQDPMSFDAAIAEIDAVEPDRKTGQNIYSGNQFEPDWEIAGPLTAQVRTERDGRATDRTCWFTVAASDCDPSPCRSTKATDQTGVDVPS